MRPVDLTGMTASDAPAPADRRDRFALIGAGPMGLAAAKTLTERGVAFDGFELHSDVGGLWDIDAPRSTMYETAHLISSRTVTEFADFPMPEGTPDYPSHRLLRDYFRAFADRFGLRDRYRFGAEVLETAPLGAKGEGWRVRWRDAEGEHKALYRGVMIANGTLSEPNMPRFEGYFAGEMMHSAAYRGPEQFAGKRVLVIGGGNSGCDIVVDAAHHGTKADIALRRGYHFVPKYVFGRPADTLGGAVRLPMWLKRRIDGLMLRWFVGDPQRLGFPEPDHALYESHPVVNSLLLFHAGHGDVRPKPDVERFEGHTVRFRDGTAEDYDVVVAATGYRLHYPFIDRALLNWQGDAPHLYLNCLHPERDDLFVLGMVEATGLGWQGRHEQAELVARYVAGLDAGSKPAEALRELKREPFPDMRCGMNYVKLSRMAYYVHKDTYRRTVARHIRELTRDAG